MQSVVGQWIFAGEKGRTSDVLACDVDLMPEGCGYAFKDTDCFISYFGTDPIAGKDGEVQKHSEAEEDRRQCFKDRSTHPTDNLLARNDVRPSNSAAGQNR